MKLLVVGGTRFLGRHFVQQALEAGHELTLMHRGRSNAGLFPQARTLIADRDGDLSVLAQGRWDVAVDTCAYVPRQVRALAAALAGRVGQMQIVSSISAYAAFVRPGTAEDAPLATLDDPTVETITGATYGGLKALCEQAALDGFGANTLVVRPGLIVGPHDPTGRYTWWVQRLLRSQPGDEVLAPGDPAGPVQCIDARDLAAWMLKQAESGTAGAFNLTGPAIATTIGAWLSTVRDRLAPQARLEWVDEGFLLEQGVAPWSDLPVWLPAAQSALHQVSIAAALATGLHCRSVAQTAADTAAWVAEETAISTKSATAETVATAAQAANAEGPPRPNVGLAPEREAALLAAWHARSTA